MKLNCLLSCATFSGLLLAPGLAGTAEPAARPLVVFVGDSITTATPSARPEYKPTQGLVHEDIQEERFGYFEALVESTAAKDVPLRLRKAGNRGQALTEALGRECRQILERRHRTLKELPAYLVVQDYFVIRKDDSESAQKAEQLDKIIRELAQLAGKVDVKLVLSTVATDPRSSSPLKAKDEEVRLFKHHLDPERGLGEGVTFGNAKGDAGKITCTVEEAGNDLLRLRMDGSARLAHEQGDKKETVYEPALLGYLTYDFRAGVITELMMVALGDVTNTPRGVRPGGHPLGIAYELMREPTTAERVPPRGARDDLERYLNVPWRRLRPPLIFLDRGDARTLDPVEPTCELTTRRFGWVREPNRHALTGSRGI